MYVLQLLLTNKNFEQLEFKESPAPTQALEAQDSISLETIPEGNEEEETEDSSGLSG